MKKRILHFLGLGGIIGPILFSSTTLICAGLRPGYSHLNQFISELGATGTPNSGLMNFFGFIPSGLMIALFGIPLIAFFQKKPTAIIGSVLITIFGLGIFLAGIFSCDQGCPDVGSFQSNIHQMIAPITFIAAILGIFLLGMAFRRMPAWRGLRAYSVVSAILSFGFLMALVSSLETRVLTGLWQRLLLVTLFSWVILTGFRVFRKPYLFQMPEK